MSNVYYLIFTLLLFVAFKMYFNVARKYNIVDLPNHRTMHDSATIRGGGIVLFLAMTLYSLFIPHPGFFFIVGISIVGITGFLDDLYNLSGKVRFPLQVISILCILAELQLFGIGLLLLFTVIIIATGTLNAYNFMDGINGMTAGYSVVIVSTLIYVNNFIFFFISNEVLIYFLLALLVFSFYNFRKKAICFAGDVGSLTIAFIVVYLIINLIQTSNQYGFILFLTLYGLDTVFTIIQRIIRKENIFDAHRLHLFQVIVSKTKMPHLSMSMIYIIIQVVINILVLNVIENPMMKQLIYIGIMLIVLSVVYIILKRKLMFKIV